MTTRIEQARELLPSTLFDTYAEWHSVTRGVAAALSAADECARAAEAARDHAFAQGMLLVLKATDADDPRFESLVAKANAMSLEALRVMKTAPQTGPALDSFEIDVNRTAPQAVWDALRHLANLSPPSQEDTGSVSGEKARPSEEVMRALCEGVKDRINGYVDEWLKHPQFRAALGLPPADGGGPGSASNTESSPTQTTAKDIDEGKACNHRWMVVQGLTLCAWCNKEHMGAVAAPGPTAGDVERALPWETLEADELCEISDVERGERGDDFVCVTRSAISDALAATGASARAELLAEITEPSRALIDAVGISLEKTATWYFHDRAVTALKVIALKLGGTKE